MQAKLSQWLGDITSLPFLHEFLSLSDKTSWQVLVSPGVRTLVLQWHDQKAVLQPDDFLVVFDNNTLKGYDRDQLTLDLSNLIGLPNTETILDAVQAYDGVELSGPLAGGSAGGAGDTAGQAFHWSGWQNAGSVTVSLRTVTGAVLYYERVLSAPAGEQPRPLEGSQDEQGSGVSRSSDGLGEEAAS